MDAPKAGFVVRLARRGRRAQVVARQGLGGDNVLRGPLSANALNNATGVRMTELPMNPVNVLKALQEG